MDKLSDILRSSVRRLTFTPSGRHLFVYDIAAVAMSILAAFALRFDANDVLGTLHPYLPAALLPILVMPPVFVGFGLYRREWRFASINEMFAIIGAVAVGTGISFVLELIVATTGATPGTTGFPRSVFFIEALLLLALVGGSRFALRAGIERFGPARGTGAGEEVDRVKTLIYGAGEVGATVARVASRDALAGLEVVGFLDDDPAKRGLRIGGKEIFGDLHLLDQALDRSGATQILIAMPRAPGAVVRRIVEAARDRGLQVRTVPPPRDLLNGEVRLTAVRSVSVEDLLRREPVTIDREAVASYLMGASILITGGGGSIGSELARQILTLGPRQLTVLDNHEEGLWNVERELAETASGMPGMQFRTVLADVRSLSAIEAIVHDLKPDVVFHAAALKHVPIVELNASEGVLTNVVGTSNVLAACEKGRVSRFVLISTDKAVDPVGAMGATKRMAEHLTVAFAHRTGNPYVAVRFGNVLGSSGSVIPTFLHQLSEGHALTVTHPDATRYFMTIGEAVSLILEAAAAPRSGEIYVLDMGDPVRIVDLASDLVRLSGFQPDQVPIVFTGLRAGERLHETLVHDHETTERTVHPGILRVRPPEAEVPFERIQEVTHALEAAARRHDDRVVREILHTVHRLGREVLESATGDGDARRERAASPLVDPQ